MPDIIYRFRQFIILNSTFIILLCSCSVQKQITKSAKENVLSAPVLQTAHVGISIYEPATNRYWYDYQGDHYFVPASNTKIATCYAAMKYLGDSLVGLRYRYQKAPWGNFEILPSGDPTFLHPDFKKQTVLEFFETNKTDGFFFHQTNWLESPLGSGWSWNDYDQSYMAERSPFPVYGNIVTFKRTGDFSFSAKRPDSIILAGLDVVPDFFKAKVSLATAALSGNNFSLARELNENAFKILASQTKFNADEIPFVTDGVFTALQILESSIAAKFSAAGTPDTSYDSYRTHITDGYSVLHSQPTDSLLKPMMHHSDNFFAEQALLMVSNERLGIMNDMTIIDTLLKTDFKELPQKPRWADGSGLSRYNLFSPRDFVAILTKMKNEFGMERIKAILATGGEGTISSYFKTENGYIFAKTGTLSGVVALSGFLYTKKNKLLIFSTLVNNHTGSATDVRRAMEKFLQVVRNKY